MAITVTHTTPADDSFSAAGAVAWNANHSLVGVGTMAEQNANNVAITGGTMSGVAITGYVPTTRTISTSTGLTGGGDLSADRTIAFADANVGAWAQNPSSANLRAAMTDETGTGSLVFANSPTLSSPLIDNSAPWIDFGNGNTVALAAGRFWYTPNTGAWNLGMGGGNITQQIGEEIFIYGKASAAITEGQLICKTGTVGASGVITFGPAPANLADNDGIIGVATENIALNGFGRITAFGVVHGINTSGSSSGQTWADGDTLWYNPAGGGLMTNVKPTAPNIKYQIATVINAGNGGSGSIQVDLLPGSQLGGTDSNVQINGVANGNILTYDGANSYWKNTDLAAGTGISVSKSANGVLTITNTSPSSGGTVTSVTGTAPVVSSGGNTPAISMAKATGSVDGYLSATDWTTFNSKQPAGAYLTAVIADSPLSGSGTSGSHLVIAQANTSTSGYLSSTDWNTFNNKQPAGTYVTAVSATAPITSTGGTTPTLAMPAASGSANGYLTSTDWTTFNNKTSNTGTVTSVGGTGSVSGLTLSGTVTTSGNLTLGGSLDLSSPPTIGSVTPNDITGATITGAKFIGVYGGAF